MPPTNTTMATALVMGALPYTNSQDLTGMLPTTGSEYNLWYQLPASLVTGGAILGAQGSVTGVGFGSEPFVRVWMYVAPPVGFYGTPYRDASSSPTYSGGPIQLPLDPTPQDYYVRLSVEDWDSSPTYAATIAVYLAPPPLPIPSGSILINSDADVADFPAVAFAAGTGALLAFLPNIIHGETGDLLPDGRLLLAGPDALYLYDDALALVTTVPLLGNVGSGNQVDTFYVLTGAAGVFSIRAVDRDGALGASWGPLTAGTFPLLVAVARDETRAYVTSGGQWHLGGAQVMTWDLVNNVALANLAAPVTSYNLVHSAAISPGGILVLADGSILVCYFKSDGEDSFIRRYSAAGATLTTYAHPTGYGLNRLAHDPTDDGLTFWAWWKGTAVETDGLGRFDRVRVSDGVVLENTTSREARFGYRVQGDSSLYSQTFGHPFSCPFFLTRTGFVPEPEPEPEPPPPGAPGYHVEARYIRRLRRAPHVNNENVRVFYRRFELDLERGQALASGQGSEPYVLLRLSRDGGQTWGEEMRMAAGKLGEYQARVMARRLGHSRDTVFEIVVSDPVAWSIVGAFLDLEPGAH